LKKQQLPLNRGVNPTAQTKEQNVAKDSTVKDRQFNESLLAAADDMFSSVGSSAKTAIYFHIENKYNIKKEDIPSNIAKFSEALDQLFGIGSKPLQKIFKQQLKTKLKTNSQITDEESLDLDSFVREIRKVTEAFATNEADFSRNYQIQQFRSETNFEALINLIADPTAVVDINGTFILINDAYTKILGIEANQCVGKSFLQIPNLSSDSKNVLFENLKRRNAGEQINLYEVDIFDGKHNLRQFEINAKKIEYLGKPADLVICRDITQRKKLENELREHAELLEQTQTKLAKSERLAAIGELAGMVGHDLRNPLTSIKAAAYYIRLKYAKTLDENGKDMLLTIDKSIEYSNKIINDLLDYSRKINLELSQTTPKKLIDEALALIDVPENIKVANLVGDAPPIAADIAKMSRVIINIVKNAIDAMPNGGNITLTSQKAKDIVELVFADTGEGMDEETQKRLWTPLFTTKAKGVGLGLAICRRIVESHGGKITVQSEVGKGTVFTVAIPLKVIVEPDNEELFIFNSSSFQIESTIK
jgi:PAS domain S-box-containing protein